jgi:hypothetical protein
MTLQVRKLTERIARRECRSASRAIGMPSPAFALFYTGLEALIGFTSVMLRLRGVPRGLACPDGRAVMEEWCVHSQSGRRNDWLAFPNCDTIR